MFWKAKVVIGKVQFLLASSGASNFDEAHRAVIWEDSRHEPHIRMDGDTSNNQLELFNGNTLCFREKVTRGLKREDSSAGRPAGIPQPRRPHLAPGGTPEEEPAYVSREATCGCP